MEKWNIEANHFEKWQACGNDFIFMREPVPEIPNWKICDRHFGIGADGIIYLQEPEEKGNDLKVQIINADGSEAEMCGNGIRCVGQFLAQRLGGTHFKVETAAGVKELTVSGIDVTVDMGEPTPHWFKLLQLPDKEYEAYHLDIGNPHCVLMLRDHIVGEVEKYGPMIENIRSLFPDKTNVEFMEIRNRSTIRVRVWERGVGRTLACGTGACASACVAHDQGRTKDVVTVLLDGGELEVDLRGKTIKMTGPAEYVYRGEIYPPPEY